MPRSSRGALMQYILNIPTSINDHQIFLHRTKMPTLISITPSMASHIQYGRKHMSSIIPIAIKKNDMTRRMTQFPQYKISPP